MKRLAPAVCLLLLCCLSAAKRGAEPAGDMALITMPGGTSYPVELLAVDDASLFALHRGSLTRFALADIARVRVGAYSVRDQKVFATAPLIAADIALAVALRSSLEWALVFAGLAPLTAGAALAEWNRVDFDPPLSAADQRVLAACCRYPQGLTEAQWQELLHHFSQDAPIPMPAGAW